MIGRMAVPSIPLNDGTSIPQVGFGVFQVPADETERAVTAALEAGYRHIDTAAIYGNEEGVGRAIAASGLARGDLYVTTKLWNADQGADRAPGALRRSLERLGLDHVDLYLIHWPVPSADRYVETWGALQELREQGLTRSVGVSNFTPEHLERAIAETGAVPAVNQIEAHPRLAQEELRAEHARRGIATEAYSPLAQAEVLDDPTLGAIAEAHGVTPAQVVLRWHVQLGSVVIPKSVTPERIAANLDLFGFALSDEEVARITGLSTGERVGGDPETFAIGARAY